MANSSIVLSLKKKVIDALCDDPDICSLIDSSKYKGRELKNTHIFSYNRNPDTITEALTFITVGTSIGTRDRNGTFVTPVLTINIYSENNHMDIKNIFTGKIEEYNRNDYLSMLIDEKFNGSSEFGTIGKLKLVENYENNKVAETFLSRTLIFEGMDTNDSMCGWR